jgi:hypothetical protein
MTGHVLYLFVAEHYIRLIERPLRAGFEIQSECQLQRTQGVEVVVRDRQPKVPESTVECRKIRGEVEYLGGKPRGFTLWCSALHPAGEYNPLEFPQIGPAGSETRTLAASVRAGRSTTTRQHPSHPPFRRGVGKCRIPVSQTTGSYLDC